MFAELLTLNIFGYLLIFARVGGAMTFLPGFSGGTVSPRIRLAFALMFTLAIFPVLLPILPRQPDTTTALVLLLVGELTVGIFFGLIAQVLISTAQTAGSVVAFTSGLANAMVEDPVSKQQGSIIATFLSLSGLTLIFITDLHHLMIRGVVDSYWLFVPGQAPQFADAANMMTEYVAHSFYIGVQIASPFIVLSLVYYSALGLMSRLAPQLQIFFVAMPILQLLAFSVLGIALSTIMAVFLRHFADGLARFFAF